MPNGPISGDPPQGGSPSGQSPVTPPPGIPPYNPILPPHTEIPPYPTPVTGMEEPSLGSLFPPFTPYPLLQGNTSIQSPTHQVGGPRQILPPWTQLPFIPGKTEVIGPVQVQQRYLDIVDDCMRSVTIVNPPAGSYIDVFVNGVWKGSAIASDSILDVPIAVCSLKIGDLIQVHLDGLTAGLTTRVVSHVPYSVLTQHYDNARTGWNPYEKQLTVKNVPGLDPNGIFQMLEVDEKPLEGQIYAQPLYMHQQYFLSKGAAYNVVYIATEMDVVYAFDADASHQGEDPDPPYLWKRTLLPVGNSPLNPHDIDGRNVCNCKDTYENVAPHIGITGTPVIDCGCSCDCAGDCGCCSTPTLYVVSKSKRTVGRTTSYHTYLHALDVLTGIERPISPVEITGQVPGIGGGSTDKTITDSDGKGNVIFVSKWHLQRPGLLLLDGVVYIAFGSHDDDEPTVYHGWVMAYDAKTLEQKNIFCTTPNNKQTPPDTIDCKNQTCNNAYKGGGSIWMSGMGLASDGEAIYCTTGNGMFDANLSTTQHNYGNTVLKLSKDLQVLSWFTPSYQAVLNAYDIDLGSGGITIIPGMPNLLVTCGKDGNVLLLNRDNLGRYSGPTTWPPTHASNPNAVDSIVIPPGFYGSANAEPYNTPGVWGGPAYFNGSAGPTIYYCGNGIGFDTTDPQKRLLGMLTAFSLNGSSLTAVAERSNRHFTSLGTTPIVSSNNGVSGVVWAVVRSTPNNPKNSNQFTLTLRAFDATHLASNPNNIAAQCLFEGNCGTWDAIYKGYTIDPPKPGDPPGSVRYPKAGAAFIEPVVINGKVYVGSDNAVTVFGL